MSSFLADHPDFLSPQGKGKSRGKGKGPIIPTASPADPLPLSDDDELLLGTDELGFSDEDRMSVQGADRDDIPDDSILDEDDPARGASPPLLSQRPDQPV